MLGRRITIKLVTVLILCAGLFYLPAPNSAAQVPVSASQGEIARPFAEASIRAEIEKIEDDRNLTDETRQSIIELYDLAILRLLEGESDKISEADYRSRRVTAPNDIAEIDLRISTIRDALGDPDNDPLRDYADLDLNELEQQLAAKVVEASSLRNSKKTDIATRTAMAQRPTPARAELVETQQRIETLNTQIAAFDGDEATAQERAGNALARATLYARQQRALALEQEIASVQPQLSVLDKRITLKDVEILETEAVVRALQIRTGTARTMNAEQQLSDAEEALENVAGRHPYVQAYARENINLVIQLGRLVETDENLPASETRIRAQLDQVAADTNVTNQILNNETVSRSYGAHLRQLRQKQPIPGRIRTQITERSARLEDALFKRIVNQETLQAFNADPVNFETKIGQFEREEFIVDDVPPLIFPGVIEEDYEALRGLQDYRREYLNELASISAQKAAKLEEVNALEIKLLDDVVELCALLDGRLLWLPSTEPIGFDWPGKVFNGVVQTFNPAKFEQVWKSMNRGARTNYYIAILGLVFAGIFVVIRERFASVMASMSKRVGRVQKDSYVLTPIAVLDGLLQVAPWALVPLVIGAMMIGTSNGDEFVVVTVRFLLMMSVMLIIFLTVREWSKKNALFDLHFNVDKELRHKLIKNIPWFLGVQFVGLAFLGLTQGSFDFDSGSAALGVLGFLILAISITVLAFKLYWSSDNTRRKKMRDADSVAARNEKWFFVLALVLPLLISTLAIIGYYETGQLLLWRMFVSFVILLVAYILHGLMRRSVVIAQRRLALEQAKQRRDRAIRERSEKEAAEERGEIPVPSLDYEQIDLETINRQSSQLVNITVFLLVAGGLWALWANLLPALSVFNDFEFWGYDELGPDGTVVHVSFTLWNVMQAFAIGLITWFAARNLPGFLDVFIFKRLNIQQGSRFALVTVLGYAIIIIGALIAFDKLGTRWSQLQWIVAALGVGIGFGLQEIIANFISGLIILFERPVRIGDYVTIGEDSGTITRIQIRATTLIDLDNKEIFIPNKALVTDRVTNWTLSDAITRLKIPIGIAYGSDTELAHDTILGVIKSNPNVLSNPEPTALFLGFGDSSLDFEVRIYLRDFAQRFIVSHELHMAIDQALRKEGIEIPFPQRDLHLKNPDIKIVGADKPKPKPRKKAASKKRPANP